MKSHEFFGKYANLPVKERNKKCNLTWNEVFDLIREQRFVLEEYNNFFGDSILRKNE